MERRGVWGLPIARLVPWLVLLLGLVTTAVLYVAIDRVLERRTRTDFAGEVDRLTHGIDAAVGQQVALLDATAGLMAANPNIGREDFSLFYQQLTRNEAARVPAVIGVSYWRPWLRRAELARIAADHGVAGFRLEPRTPRPEAHAIVLVEPYREKNLHVQGFDMHAEPTRRQAMDAARDTGRPVMTPRIVLKQDRESPESSFLMYLPLYDGLPSGVEERRATLKGFVYSGLRTKDLFRDLTPNLVASRVGLRIWSGGRKPGDLVFEHVGAPEVAQSTTRTIHFKGAVGEVRAEFTPLEGFGTAPTVRKYVLPVGAILSCLLFALANLLRRAHEDSQRREAEQGLLAEVGRLTAGPDVEDRLETAASLMAKALGAFCRIDLLQSDGVLRTFSTRTPEMAEYMAHLEREFPRMEHDQILRAAISTGETQRADEFVPVDEAHRQKLAQFRLGPVAIVPMRARDRFVGAITLTRLKGQQPLTDHAIALAESLAGRMALAVDNARLFAEAQQEVAERRAAEAEIRRLNEDLEHRVAERTRDLEASNHELESFCYSVSHDLRTPLRSLDGFGRALEEDYGDRLDAQGLDFIGRIRASTKRMDELITALLTLSRLTRREIVPLDVDLTAMVKDQFQDLDPEGRVEAEVQEGMAVHADPRMMAVVLDNLLENAIKFSSRAERPRIAVGQTEDGEVYVRDNGAGFDMAYASKLFQPFERLHSVREFPGHGIGLATVERIVRRHGGEVRAEGRPGEGATFYVRFPR